MVQNPPPDSPAPEALSTTPLDGLHRRLGARMVPFAGYAMPVQYPDGIIAEHRHCRAHAALFDVSHMGQARLTGTAAATALERLVPGDILGLKPGRQRYTLFTNEAGGILDDLMVARLSDDSFLLVVNAARKADDFRHIAAALPAGVRLRIEEDRALLALQGPASAAVLARHGSGVEGLAFMAVAELALGGTACVVSRSGYTGEDGFEISVPASEAVRLAERLLGEPELRPAGLGARDSLRLEAGLPLYGNDIDELTTPVEAELAWTIGKRRRAAWDFPGARAIRDQIENGAHRSRVGIRPEGRAPARAATTILAADGSEAGTITSGGFSPTLNAPIAMGYVRKDLARDGASLELVVRGKPHSARVVPLPFVPHRYAH
ncbi:MAG: glycine cleavage system aminomethyltransferase GcvT [Alphaproteobacteria bacterium]|nr:glycine cleavage system aminomethyltransferase GcvT [Alphaproteobacteria bacterium]